jgi:hypothetical protein
MMAAENVSFEAMSETELRQWVVDNPGSIDVRDIIGWTPLIAAVKRFGLDDLVDR